MLLIAVLTMIILLLRLLTIQELIRVRFGDFEADIYKHKSADKLLDSWDKQKKDNNGKNCYEQHNNFSPFFSFC